MNTVCRFVFVAALLAAMASTATPAAAFIEAELLAYSCLAQLPEAKPDKDANSRSVFCNAYIDGWEDAIYTFRQDEKPYCPPAITIKEMSVAFVDYVAAHREARHIPAAEAPMLAFKSKWPCR